MQLKNFTISSRDLLYAVVGVLILLALSFGFGYFLGRYYQIQINKALLQVIPDVNQGNGKFFTTED